MVAVPPELTQPYRPNRVLRAIYQQFFDRIHVEHDWASRIAELGRQGTVLYVLRNLNWLDFFALDYLTKRHGLPEIRYVQDLKLWVLNPMGKGWLNAIVPRRGVTPLDELRDAFSHGGSGALFLKRPPNFLDATSGASGERGLQEGDELVRALFTLQREQERPIFLAPLVFLWSKFPDKAGLKPIDFIIGPRGWPSPVRSIGQYLYNHRHVALRMGEPLDVQAFLRQNAGQKDAVLTRRITYAMLSRLERERRSITGPAEKAPERVRQEIVRSPKLQSVVKEMVRSGGESRSQVNRALEMLEELQATPSAATMKGLEVVLDWVFHRIYRGIEYDDADIARLRSAAREGTLVLLPSHKSHIDYLVLSYVFNEQNLPLPRIAAGDNLNFMPIGPILRRGGAFFIRRSFKGDKLYANVVDAYIRRLIRDGSPIEVFLEGGRSRTGKLLEPKFGLLKMVTDAALAVSQRQVFFAPLSIGYERVVEASAYRRELSGGEKRKEDATELLRTSEILRHRYGRVNVQVGQLLTIEDLCQELGLPRNAMDRPAKRRALVTRLGNRVMDEINRVTALTPGALTALALLCHPLGSMSDEALLDLCSRLYAVCRSMGARSTPTLQEASGTLRPAAIREAVEMFCEANLVICHDPKSRRRESRRRAHAGATYSVVESQRMELDTSKNVIVHFFVERGLIACSMGRDARLPTALPRVAERVQVASRLLKHEFRFRADARFGDIFAQTVDALCEDGHLERRGPGIVAGAGTPGHDGSQWVATYRAILRPFFEGYRIAANSLGLLLGAPLTEKDLIKRALVLGHKMFVAGQIQGREAVSKSILQNAVLSFSDLGYIRSREGKLELAEAYQSLDSVSEIERSVVDYINGFEVEAVG